MAPRNAESIAYLGHKKPKGILIPAMQCNVDALRDHGYRPEQLLSVDQEMYYNIRPEEHPCYSKAFDHQKDTIERAFVSCFPGILLHLSPGLGKTFISILLADCFTRLRQQVLVICQKILFATWQSEINQWSIYKDPEIWHGSIHKQGHWVVTNYEYLQRHPEAFAQHWSVVIIDESLLIANPDAKRSKVISKLKRDRAILLSGNPTNRYYDDLWMQLHVVWPEAFKGYWKFAEEWCVIEENAWGKKPIASRLRRDPIEHYSDVIIRKTQQEELPGLPQYIERRRDITLDKAQQRIHNELRDGFVTELESGAELTALNNIAALIRMQQVVSGLVNVDPTSTISAKHDAVLEMFNSNDVELPAIIWVNWKPSGIQLAQKIKKLKPHLRVGIANGDDAKSLELYKQGQVDVLLLSLAVAKFGHTLTNTQHVIYVDRTLNPDDYIQSRARVVRIGLKHHPVLTVIRAPGSVDDIIEDILAGKLASIAVVNALDLLVLLKGLGRWR